MTIKSKMKLNFYAFLIVASYMTTEWYEAAIMNWLAFPTLPFL